MGGKTLKRSRDDAQGDTGASAPSKRSRKTHQDATTLAKLYNDLAAESDDLRLAAAKQLILKFSPESEPTAEAVEQALRRLTRGLCSQRKAARVGFCITLTELLRQSFSEDSRIPGLKIDRDGIIGLVEANTTAPGGAQGLEKRNYLFGRLFGYKAIMQSSVLTEPQVSVECWSKVVEKILELARNVPWLREECGLILLEAMNDLDPTSPFPECVQGILSRLVSFGLDQTAEAAAIWLSARTKFPASIFPQSVWQKNDPLSSKNRRMLAKALKENFQEASSNSDGASVKSAKTNPNPIFPWNIVFAEALQRDQQVLDEKGDSAKVDFPQVWKDLVDNNLFTTSTAHERKAWGFKLFARMIGTVPVWALPVLFSPNILRCLINSSKKDDRFLHAAALASLEAIEMRAQQDPSSAATLVAAIHVTQGDGAPVLGRSSMTKTLEQIVLSANDTALAEIVQQFRSVVLRPGVDDQVAADTRRRGVADILTHIVKGYKRYNENEAELGSKDSWLQRLLSILVEMAYFIPSATAKTSRVPLPSISEASREVFQERLSSCLTRLIDVGHDSQTSYPFVVVNMIHSKVANDASLTLMFKADESVRKTVKEAHKSLDSVAAKMSKPDKRSTAQGLLLLYSLALLQVYGGDGDAVLMLEELDTSRKSMLKKASEEQADDTFVEILLSFLGNPRSLFRKIAEQAFTAFTPDLTIDGLQSLTSILDIEETVAGQRELFEQAGDHEEATGSDDENEDDEDEDDDDKDDDNEDDDDDDDEASDVEMIEGESVDPAENESDQSSDDEDSSSSTSDDENDDEELAQFNSLLARTLQTTEDEPSDESDMDDEQMMALDSQLVKIFQQRSKNPSNKKQKQDAKQTVVQFKSRILDLLAIYVEKESSNPLTLELILPLLQRTRPGGTQAIIDKSYKILKTLFEKKHGKFTLPKVNDEQDVWELMGAIHKEAKLGRGATLHGNACSSASLHLAKVLLTSDKANYERIVDVYAESQKQWFADKESGLQSTLFLQFLNWSQDRRKQSK